MAIAAPKPRHSVLLLISLWCRGGEHATPEVIVPIHGSLRTLPTGRRPVVVSVPGADAVAHNLNARVMRALLIGQQASVHAEILAPHDVPGVPTSPLSPRCSHPSIRGVIRTQCSTRR